MEHYAMYHKDIPDFLMEFAGTPAVQRLKQVGMNCGCEYTSFPLFGQLQGYSRYDHSVGVGLIVWHFTQDKAQAIAGLLHDIATPAFAHVIDFLNGDHVKQESTEAGTTEMINNSAEVQELLRKYRLSTADVCDYHQYPIADNDSPRLSADRLEYSLGNMINYGFSQRDTMQRLYADLTIGKNEDGQPELMFETASAAEEFAMLTLKCSRVYVSDEDRYAMQHLAQLIRDALVRGVICPDDLYTTETEVIRKLRADAVMAAQWEEYRALKRMIITDEKDEKGRVINAKKRFIDPMVKDKGRASDLSPKFNIALKQFNQMSFAYPVRGMR